MMVSARSGWVTAPPEIRCDGDETLPKNQMTQRGPVIGSLEQENRREYDLELYSEMTR
jgi:hypothetical protein